MQYDWYLKLAYLAQGGECMVATALRLIIYKHNIFINTGTSVANTFRILPRLLKIRQRYEKYPEH